VVCGHGSPGPDGSDRGGAAQSPKLLHAVGIRTYPGRVRRPTNLGCTRFPVSGPVASVVTVKDAAYSCAWLAGYAIIAHLHSSKTEVSLPSLGKWNRTLKVRAGGNVHGMVIAMGILKCGKRVAGAAQSV